MKLSLAGWSLGGVLVALLLAALGLGVIHSASQGPKSVGGAPAPDITIQSLDGRDFRLADLRGTPVVLNFWASWCVPCRQEAPVLAAAARANKGRVQFLGADIQDTDEGARAYEAEIQSPYPVGPITRGSYRDFGVTAPPETYFIDRRGVVVSKILGPVDSQRMKLFLSQIMG